VKKLLIIGAAVAGAALLAKRFAPRMQEIDWEQRIAAMPDTAPPKWMFTNIKAIRDNSDRILELLEQERGQRQHEAH
jgi:hypothetical protein